MDKEEIEQYQQDVSEVQEDMVEMQEEAITDVPTQKRNLDLYSLFDKVRTTSDSTKVGNLKNREIGELNITVRDAQRISLIAKTFHHEKFSNFYRQLAEITTATSASRDGWLVELFVTNKKFSSKTRSSGNQVQNKGIWNKFNSNNNSNNQQESGTQ